MYKDRKPDPNYRKNRPQSSKTESQLLLWDPSSSPFQRLKCQSLNFRVPSQSKEQMLQPSEQWWEKDLKIVLPPTLKYHHLAPYVLEIMFKEARHRTEKWVLSLILKLLFRLDKMTTMLKFKHKCKNINLTKLSKKLVFIYFILFNLIFGKSIVQVPDTGTQVLDNTRPFLCSSIVSFWITLACSKERKYHIFGQYWYTKNVPVLTNTGTFQYLGPEVYFS